MSKIEQNIALCWFIDHRSCEVCDVCVICAACSHTFFLWRIYHEWISGSYTNCCIRLHFSEWLRPLTSAQNATAVANHSANNMLIEIFGWLKPANYHSFDWHSVARACVIVCEFLSRQLAGISTKFILHSCNFSALSVTLNLMVELYLSCVFRISRSNLRHNEKELETLCHIDANGAFSLWRCKTAFMRWTVRVRCCMRCEMIRIGSFEFCVVAIFKTTTWI